MVQAGVPPAGGTYNGYVRALATNGTRLFAGTSGGGVYLLAGNTANWTAVNSGLTNLNVYSLAVRGTDIFAGTWGGGVWRRPLSEMATSVDQSLTGLPEQFSLSQNYPNPFNPSTTIRYALPQRSQVILTVFNTLGQQIALLQNGEQEAGYHEVKFDGNGLSSGVYLCRFQAGEFVQTSRLLPVR
jgi:hypothetical protein